MSISRDTYTAQPDKIPNPAKKFLEWKNGQWEYWDKEASKRCSIPANKLRFVPIDLRCGVVGWSKKHERSIWSSEVANVTEEAIAVFVHGIKEPIARGIWRDIRDAVKAAGGRFARTVYALASTGSTGNGQWELIHIALSGATVKEFMDLEKQIMQDAQVMDPCQAGIILGTTGTKEGKEGGVVWKAPLWAYKAADASLINKAREIDQQILGPYFEMRRAAAQANASKGAVQQDALAEDGVDGAEAGAGDAGDDGWGDGATSLQAQQQPARPQQQAAKQDAKADVPWEDGDDIPF